MSIQSRLLAILVSVFILSGAAFAGAVEDELMAVDRAFNAMAQEDGVGKAFAHYMSEDARMLSGGSQPVLGHEAVAAAMAGYPADATLVWDPEEAVAAASGDMGFTWGRYVSTFTDAEGVVHTGHGKYVSIWQKQSGGGWKASVDIGNTNPDPAESSPE